MMAFIGTLFVGLIVGLLARAIKPGDDKMGWIMTILLGMEKDEAERVIAKAPCRLLEAVPRDRARTIKTVLEGTGATIAWQETGT